MTEVVEYPRKLIDRDPREFEHRNRAFKLMVEVGEVGITHQTGAEIKKSGTHLPDSVITVDEVPLDSVIVCAHYFLDEGLFVPTNLISKCADCAHAVQFRSYMPTEKSTFLCCFCAADRVLSDYWNRVDNSEVVKQK